MLAHLASSAFAGTEAVYGLSHFFNGLRHGTPAAERAA
jgi:hypothetical protein